MMTVNTTVLDDNLTACHKLPAAQQCMFAEVAVSLRAWQPEIVQATMGSYMQPPELWARSKPA